MKAEKNRLHLLFQFMPSLLLLVFFILLRVFYWGGIRSNDHLVPFQTSVYNIINTRVNNML